MKRLLTKEYVLNRFDIKGGKRAEVVQGVRASRIPIAPRWGKLYVGSESGAGRVYKLVGRDGRTVDRMTAEP